MFHHDVPGIENAIKHNIPILITSRCPKGRVLDIYGYEGGGHHLKLLVRFHTKSKYQKLEFG
jgi:L-asparaginase/Glu-tRNA(Gln) amidotransferase subunit D